MRQTFRRSSTPRAMGVVLLIAAVAATLAAGTGVTTRASAALGYPRIGGIVPPSVKFVPPPKPLGTGNLIYHGGPVMHTNKTYAIYWAPSGYPMSASYKALIDRYFTDVAAASGATSNVYSVETQYYDTVSGYLTTNSTFGGSVTDTTPFPANAYTSCGGPAKCLSDGQLITEINSVIAAQGWVKNNTTQFFIFTPQNVGSCSSPSSCSYTVFCAYHGYASGLIYANQPYAAVPGCDTDHPNGDAADATINVTSHEHREAINDFQLNAWYDSQGYEGSDKCAWIFGTALGGSPGARWN